MGKSKQEEFAEFCLVMGEAYPDKNKEELAKALVKLSGLSKKIKRLTNAESFLGLSDSEKDRVKKAEKEAEEISKKMGFNLEQLSDYRGYALKFVLPTGRSNSMGGKSWGIY